MPRGRAFFNVKYPEGSLDPKTALLIHFAVSVAIGHEFGAKHDLAKARECGATEDEITETLVYTMLPAAAKVYNPGKALSASDDCICCVPQIGSRNKVLTRRISPFRKEATI